MAPAGWFKCTVDFCGLDSSGEGLGVVDVRSYRSLLRASGRHRDRDLHCIDGGNR